MHQHPQELQVKVWDIWMRLFHWSLAASVTFLLISGESGWLFFESHRLLGEFVVLLICFRLCWGVIGSKNAQLLPLITHPKHAYSHLKALVTKQATQERKHSASGGWAVLLMLSLIGFQAFSGLFIADQDELLEGVFYGVLSDELARLLMKLHYQNALLLQVILLVHVAVVAAYWLHLKINLTRPMITGYLTTSDSNKHPPFKASFQNSGIGFVLFLALSLLAIYLFKWF